MRIGDDLRDRSHLGDVKVVGILDLERGARAEESGEAHHTCIGLATSRRNALCNPLPRECGGFNTALFADSG